jgi:hypothetical protein
MKVKTALLLAFALTFQPILATSHAQSTKTKSDLSWYDSPLVWLAGGFVVVIGSIFFVRRWPEAALVVIPTAVAVTVAAAQVCPKSGQFGCPCAAKKALATAVGAN